MKNSKEALILSCSNRLFIQNGYRETTMRQISSEAGVSLGLATYYFKTKRNIAVLIMEKYLKNLEKKLAPHMSRRLDPLLYSAAYIRLYIEFFLAQPCRQFYLECLQHDIHIECMDELGDASPYSIDWAFDCGLSPDRLLLYGSYIPASAEKLLILKKESGGFAGIDYDEIPDIVFHSAMEKLADSGAVSKASVDGRALAKKVLSDISPNTTQILFG